MNECKNVTISQLESLTVPELKAVLRSVKIANETTALEFIAGHTEWPRGSISSGLSQPPRGTTPKSGRPSQNTIRLESPNKEKARISPG